MSLYHIHSLHCYGHSICIVCQILKKTEVSQIAQLFFSIVNFFKITQTLLSEIK